MSVSVGNAKAHHYTVLGKRFRAVTRVLAAIYMLSALMGVITPSKQLYEEATQQALQLFNAESPLLFFNILYNNLAVIFMTLASSILVIPGIMLFIENAYLAGTFIGIHIESINTNNTISFVVSALLPVTLEALALVYAAGIGLIIAIEVIWRKRGYEFECLVLYMLPRILAMLLVVFVASILAVL